MAALDDILKLAQDCFAKARAAALPSEKAQHIRMGDKYLETAKEMRREQTVIPATFPKPVSKSG